MTIAGEAGSGKSTLVKTLVTCIRKMFGCNDSVFVAAPTGSASFNGGGVTMHRLFGIPVSNHSAEIGPNKLKRMRETFQNIVMLIFDERSMICAKDLAIMESYARKFVHNGRNEEEFFGGIPIILMVGDDYQLPPAVHKSAADTFEMSQKEMMTGKSWEICLNIAGGEAFRKFGENYVKLKTSKRALEGEELLHTCLKGVRGDTIRGLSQSNINRLMGYHFNSHGYWTEEKKKAIENDERTIYLFANNEEKHQHNHKKLREFNTENTPVAVIKAVASSFCGSRMSNHYDNERCPRSTMICVGCKVALIGINIKPEWGLYHGSIGTVIDIVYPNKKGPHQEGKPEDKMPAYVMVRFPQYQGPNFYKDDSLLDMLEIVRRQTWVPIPVFEGRCSNNGACSRHYMPLALAFARTIHSFQGTSVGVTQEGRPDNIFHRIVCNPGTRKFEGTNPGLFYTLLSQITTFGDENRLETSSIFFISSNMNYDRIKNITKKQDGKPYLKVTRLKRWVAYLEKNEMKKLKEEEVHEIVQWVREMIENPMEQFHLEMLVGNASDMT